MRLGLLSMLTVLPLSLSACGEDEDEGSPSSSVTVEAVEYEFKLSVTPTADTEEITFDNQGEEFHELIFARLNQGFTAERAIRLRGSKGSAETFADIEAKPGESKSAQIIGLLKPGDYVMLCPVEGKEGPHSELGQLEEFAIE